MSSSAVDSRLDAALDAGVSSDALKAQPAPEKPSSIWTRRLVSASTWLWLFNSPQQASPCWISWFIEPQFGSYGVADSLLTYIDLIRVLGGGAGSGHPALGMDDIDP